MCAHSRTSNTSAEHRPTLHPAKFSAPDERLSSKHSAKLQEFLQDLNTDTRASVGCVLVTAHFNLSPQSHRPQSPQIHRRGGYAPIQRQRQPPRQTTSSTATRRKEPCDNVTQAWNLDISQLNTKTFSVERNNSQLNHSSSFAELASKV